MTTDNNAASFIRVLLVEDHLLTRIGLKTVIDRTTDIRVIGEAENGEQAVQTALELRPDVILMDVGMPIMDGIEAAGKIKKSLEHVGIVMLTSHDNERDIFASLSSGASGYCLKDVEPERLFTAIRTVHSGDSWLDSNIAAKILKQHRAMSASSTVPEPNEPSSGTPKGTSESLARAQESLPEPLSPRELEVLNLLVEGNSNQQIADTLYVSLATAKTHVRNILNKLAVDDRTQAAVNAMRRGLV